MKINRVLFLTVIALAFFELPASAQLTRQWVARYSGILKSGNDAATALAVDDSGNVYVTGWTTRFSAGTDFATIKYSSNGELLWAAFQDSGSDDKATAIALDTVNDAIYVTGTSGNGGATTDFLTIKYDVNGNKLWAVKFNNPVGNGEDHPVAIATNDSGNVYVTGWSNGGASGFDYATVKYDASGTLKWVKYYNGPANGDDRPYAMALRGTSDLYVTGASTDTMNDYFTIRYNAATGDSTWAARYNGPGDGDDIARAIVLRGSTEVYVTGGSQGSSTGYDYATIKYASDVFQWVSRYDGSAGGDDQAYSIAVNGSGSGGKVFVTGKSLGIGSANDFVTIRYRQDNGSEDYVQRYNGAANDEDAAVAVTGGARPYVLGSSVGVGTGKDFAIVQYNNNGTGTLRWETRYSAPANGDDIPAAMVLSGGDLFVTGKSVGKSLSTDFLTIKYVDPSEMKYRTFTQDSLTGKSANLGKIGSVVMNANVRDTAFAHAYPKLKKGYAGAPGGLLLGDIYLDSMAYGWVRITKGSNVAKFLPQTGADKGFDSIAGKPFIGEKKDPSVTKYNSHIVGELLALRINIGASDAEVTPPTFGDIQYSADDTVNGIPLQNKNLRDIAALTDNFITYWKRYPPINWALLDSVLSRTNRAFVSTLKVVSRQPLVVTGDVPIDSVGFLSAAPPQPEISPLIFVEGSLEETPVRYSLYQNYPNPFNPFTTIEFDLPQAALVSVTVYDILGREVAPLLENTDLEEGRHEVRFDASSFASGVYFYRIVVNNGEFQKVKKMVLLK